MPYLRVTAADGTYLPLAGVFARAGAAVMEDYAEWIPEGASADSVGQLYKGESTLLGGPDGKKIMYAFGAEFVEIRVNVRTREIRVARLVGAFAAGRIMNPHTAHSQLMGGLIWGVGSALHQATEIDPRKASYINRDLAEYLVPVNADIQQVEVILVPEEDREVNPAGVKGLVSWATSAPMQPLLTRFITPQANAFAIFRSA